MNLKYVIGIDPSSGSKSPVALAVIKLAEQSEDSQEGLGQVVYTAVFKPPSSPDVRKRLKFISAHIIKEFNHILKYIIIDEEDLKYTAIGIEHTVMQGKGGESLAKAVGAILVATPQSIVVHEVSNMQMKVVAGGSGRADKKDIGMHLQTILPKSKSLLMQLTASSQWDIIDSIGIGVACHEKFYKKPVPSLRATPKQAKQKGRPKSRNN